MNTDDYKDCIWWTWAKSYPSGEVLKSVPQRMWKNGVVVEELIFDEKADKWVKVDLTCNVPKHSR